MKCAHIYMALKKYASRLRNSFSIYFDDMLIYDLRNGLGWCGLNISHRTGSCGRFLRT
jgi:hypothetical protein